MEGIKWSPFGNKIGALGDRRDRKGKRTNALGIGNQGKDGGRE